MLSTDLCMGADPITFSLNVECQEEDFYTAKDSKMFFIIKRESNNDHFSYQCKHVKDLKDSANSCNKQMLE